MNTIGLSLASLLLTTTPQVTAAVPTNNLTVAVFNDAHVPPTVLAGAQETASYIFAKSGIEIHWMLCGREDESPEERSACSQPEFPGHLDVHIVSDCRSLPISVFGISYLSPEGIGSQADVFYARIAAFRKSNPAELQVLLGYAMAHELGHLLLGSNSHSPAGLMRGDWRTKDLADMAQGGLGFNDEQTQKIKTKLSTFATRKVSSLGRPSATGR
jgi:hypothetical protein